MEATKADNDAKGLPSQSEEEILGEARLMGRAARAAWTDLHKKIVKNEKVQDKHTHICLYTCVYKHGHT